MTSTERVVRAVAADMADMRDQLNGLDGVAGDGDLGNTIVAASEAIVAILPELEALRPEERLRRIGLEISRRAPSSSGTLVAFAFLAAAKVPPGDGDGGPPTAGIARWFRAGTDAIRQRGKASPGEKTLVDALEPACDVLEEASIGPVTTALVADALAQAADAAERGAQATASMVPQHGRAAWLAARSADHEDAGARAIALLLRSVARHATEPPSD